MSLVWKKNYMMKTRKTNVNYQTEIKMFNTINWKNGKDKPIEVSQCKKGKKITDHL